MLGAVFVLYFQEFENTSRREASSLSSIVHAAQDIPSFAANFTGFQQQSADVLANFNAWSVVSESCYQWQPG